MKEVQRSVWDRFVGERLKVNIKGAHIRYSEANTGVGSNAP